MSVSVFAGHGQNYTWGAATVASGDCLLLGTRSNATGTATEGDAQFFVTRDTTFHNMTGYSSGSMTITLRVAGVDTALTISPNNSIVSDTTHAVVVPAGSLVSVKVTGAAGAQALVSVEAD